MCREPGREVQFLDHPGKESKTGPWEYETYVPISELEAEKERHAAMVKQLAECYRATGEEPAGVDSMDAMYAVQAVKNARAEYESEPEKAEARAEAAEKALKLAAYRFAELEQQAREVGKRISEQADGEPKDSARLRAAAEMEFGRAVAYSFAARFVSDLTTHTDNSEENR